MCSCPWHPLNRLLIVGQSAHDVVTAANQDQPACYGHSMMRVAAGASGFFTVIQSAQRPERYGASRRLLTIPSSTASRCAPRRHCALDADNCTLSPENVPVRLVKYTGRIVPNMEMCHENARCCSGPRHARCIPVFRPVGPRRSGKSIPLADVYRSGCRSERAGQVSLAIEVLLPSGGGTGLLSGLRL